MTERWQIEVIRRDSEHIKGDNWACRNILKWTFIGDAFIGDHSPEAIISWTENARGTLEECMQKMVKIHPSWQHYGAFRYRNLDTNECIPVELFQ